MFCAERKQAYIDFCESEGADQFYRKKIRLLFNSTESFETDENTDISEMSSEQVAALIKYGIIRKTRFFTSLCILRSYAVWCVTSGFCEDFGDILRFVPDGLDKTRRSMVSGDAHLQKYLDIIMPPEDEGKADNLIRAYVWLIYAGLAPDEIVTVRGRDIDFDLLSVSVGDHVFEISPFSVRSLTFAAKAQTIAIDHPAYKAKSRIPGDMIMRGSKSILDPNDIAHRLRDLQQEGEKSGKTDMHLKTMDIYKSGRFAEMYAAEMTGVFPDFTLDIEELARHKNDESLNEFAARGLTRRELNNYQLQAAFLEDYSKWKLAFTTIQHEPS